MSEIALITDSASYIPPPLRDRYGISVVPLNIEMEGESLQEPDIDIDRFYTRLAEGAQVTTSQPSPGQLIEAYQQAACDGAEAVLSIHIGANISGTVQSARLAAESSPVPVTIIDTGQASFAEGLCVLEAAEALARGAAAEEAAALATAASGTIGNTFVVRAMNLVERSGRLAPGQETNVEGVPVMAHTPEGMKVLASATSLHDAVETMAAHVADAAEEAQPRRLRAGIGHGSGQQVAAALRERLRELSGVEEIIDYTVGPAVGAHLGPGNAGAVFLPRPVTSA